MWSQGTVCHDESSDDAGAARTGQPPLNVDRNIVDGGDAHVVDATGVGLRVDDAWRPDQSPLQGALLRPHRELVIASSVWNLKLNSDTIRISLTPTRFVLHRYRVLPSYVRFFIGFTGLLWFLFRFFLLNQSAASWHVWCGYFLKSGSVPWCWHCRPIGSQRPACGFGPDKGRERRERCDTRKRWNQLRPTGTAGHGSVSSVGSRTPLALALADSTESRRGLGHGWF